MSKSSPKVKDMKGVWEARMHVIQSCVAYTIIL